MVDALSQPWPWYIAGPLIGLMVPVLLILGNKSFGISSSLRHICAACMPGTIKYFNYNWKSESWNLIFVLGVLLGGLVARIWLYNPEPLQLNPQLVAELKSYGVTPAPGLIPSELFSWDQLFTLKGFLLMVVGGFLVGFGTRYAGGCTSGHSIMGLSNLQWSSLIATCCFMAGGFIVANWVLPWILSL